MKKYIILILMLIWISSKLYSQNDVRALEAQIKGSSDYYWGQYKSVDEKDSKNNALDALLYKIAFNQKIDINVLKISVTGIDYISWKVESVTMTVAYVKKEHVINILNEKKDMHIVPIEYTEATNPVQENTKDRNISSDNIVKQDSKNESSQNGIESGIHQSDLNTRSEEFKNQEKVNKLVSFQYFDDMINWLNKEKESGNLVYGRKSDFQSYESSCYIAIIDGSDKKVLTVLSPGDSERKDLKNRITIKSFEVEFKNKIAIWIHFL